MGQEYLLRMLVVLINISCTVTLQGMRQKLRERHINRRMSGTVLRSILSASTSENNNLLPEHTITNFYAKQQAKYLTAAHQNNYEQVQEMLKHKYIDVDVTDSEHYNALHLALMAESETDTLKNIVLLLMAKGININTLTPQGERPLEQAANKNFYNIVYLLLSRDAEYEPKQLKLHKNKLNLIKIIYKIVLAVKQENIYALEKYLNRLQITLDEPRKLLNKFIAERNYKIFKKHEHILQEILANDQVTLLKKLDPECLQMRDERGNTLLHLALEFQAQEIVGYLVLQKLIDPLVVNSAGETTLATALRVTHANGSNLNMFEYMRHIVSKSRTRTRTHSNVHYGESKFPLYATLTLHERKPLFLDCLAPQQKDVDQASEEDILLEHKVEEEAVRLLSNMQNLQLE